jgi:hypothetical protein
MGWEQYAAMTGISQALRQQWGTSRSFRVLTVLALIGLLINLALTALWQLEVFAFDENPPANDLKIYLEAGERFLNREDLYIAPRPDFGLYAYSPPFAALMGLLTYVPYQLLWLFDALLHIVIYWALYWRWYTLFRQQGLNGAAETLVRLFPLWLIFTGLLYEIAYMNIYIFMAFIATLLLEAMLYQEAGKAILWLTILLLVKPQWAFALGIPFLLGQWRFLGKVMGGAVLAYLAIFALMSLITGGYALEQYLEYVQFLGSIPGSFIWNTMSRDGHIGYNNSIMQLVVFFTENARSSVGMTTAVKILLSLPLLAVFWRFRRTPPEDAAPALILEWAFALYLLAFLWLDVVTELTFGIVVFSYLLGTLADQSSKAWARLLFLPYALTLIWITFSGIASFVAPLPDILIDPSLFIPFILIALLGLYGLLLWRLKNRLWNESI